MGRYMTGDSGSGLTVKELRHTSNNSATRDGTNQLYSAALPRCSSAGGRTRQGMSAEVKEKNQ